MRALRRKLLRELWRLRAPGLAVALVVASGLATFAMSYSTIDTLQESRDAFYEGARFADVFARARRAPLSLVPRIAAIEGVEEVQARIVADVTVTVPGFDEPVAARLCELPRGDVTPIDSVHVTVGRRPEAERRGEVLVSEGFALAHGLAPGAPLEVVLNGRWERLRVVGAALSPEHVYAIRPGGLFPDDLRFGVLWMGRDELEAALGMRGAFNDVALSLAPGASERDVIAALDTLLARHGGIGAHGRAEQLSHFYLSGELDQLRAMGRAAPAIFLGVAAFLLHVVLTRLVATQRSQVATLKAFGYPERVIAGHYLQLVLAMTCAGVAIGAVAGAWLGHGMVSLYADYYRFPVLQYRLGTDVVLAGLLMAVALGVAATLGAVLRIARLPPAEAMRPESPPAFRRSVLESLGLRRVLPPAGLMALRRLERRPARALLSCGGLALAVAILVLSRFAIDAVDAIVDLQFNAAQRDDVAIAFTEPRAAAVLHDVSRIPGVLRAEPYRVVPVRVRHDAASRGVGLMGVPADADLHRVLQRDRAIVVPPEGLVLSSKLASILGVRAGDPVLVEILEGERRHALVPVARVTEQFIGVAATMEISALNRLLREGPVVSGALVSADPARLSELYRRLRDAPAVATVSLRRAAVASLERTMDETMLRMTLFNILFATIIAFGVVYNIARVSLAEQARELATLRVLGLSRAEVSSVLLGELAVLTLASLPLGLLAGRGLGRLMVSLLDTELYRIPLVVSRATDGFAVIVVAAAAALSALVVRRSVDRLDLVAVLKAAE